MSPPSGRSIADQAIPGYWSVRKSVSSEIRIVPSFPDAVTISSSPTTVPVPRTSVSCRAPSRGRRREETRRRNGKPGLGDGEHKQGDDMPTGRAFDDARPMVGRVSERFGHSQGCWSPAHAAMPRLALPMGYDFAGIGESRQRAFAKLRAALRAHCSRLFVQRHRSMDDHFIRRCLRMHCNDYSCGC